MPLYEYRCLECDDVFESRASIAQADDARCPEGHDRVKRLLSRFAVGSSAAAAAGPLAGGGGGGGCCGGACGCG